MHKFALLAFLLPISVFAKDANVHGCTTPKIHNCLRNFTTITQSAGQNKTKICKAGNSYMDCLDNVLTVCNFYHEDNQMNQRIALVQKLLHQIGCDIKVQDCATRKIKTCATDFAVSTLSAERDKPKFCRAGNSYLDCLNNVVTDCNIDHEDIQISQGIDKIQKLLNQTGCDDIIKDCSTSTIQTCVGNFNNASAVADQDNTKLCSIAISYMECLNKLASDCNMGLSGSPVSQAVTTAQKTLHHSGCVNGASGTLYSIVAIVLGVGIHRPF